MLNFKDWEKVASDKKTTTLKHKNGHTMTLAHSKLPKLQQEHLKRLKFAEGTPEGTVSDSKDKNAGDVTPPATNITVNAAAPQGNVPQQSAAPAPINIPQAPKVQPALLPNGSMSAPGAAQSSQAGLDLGAQVAGEKAKADANYQQQYLHETQRLAAQNQSHIDDLKAHTDDFAQYLKTNPISPNAYLENMGAGHKIATGLGLLLSGAGSGLSGQSNMAMDFLNKQIDRNIDAQKARSEQQKTIWGAYHNLYSDENSATALAKVSMNDMLVHQAEMTAAQLGTATAQANLLQLKGAKAAENNKLIIDAAGNLGSTPNMPKGGGAAPSSQGTVDPHGEKSENSQIDPNDVSSFTSGKNHSGITLGNESAEANIDSKHKQLIKPDEYADSPILSKDAQAKLDSLRYSPKARDEIDQIKSQYTAAQQADTILGQLHDVHQQLYKDAQEGGRSGYLRRHDPTSHIPVVGPMISSIGVGPLTDNQTNRSYDTGRTRVVSDIANALKGSNVSGEDINRIVDANSPEHGDTPEMVAKKERAIRIFIKNNVNKSLLHDWHLSSKEK